MIWRRKTRAEQPSIRPMFPKTETQARITLVILVLTLISAITLMLIYGIRPSTE
jgi:hypothetical protein